MSERRHYGVIGMKWGVRKDRYKSNFDKDTKVKAGTHIQTIPTGDKGADLNRKSVYVSTNKKDTSFYNSYLADSTKDLSGHKKAFTNDLLVKKDITIPSQETAVKTFVEMYNKDPQGVSDAIARAASERRRIGKVNALMERRLQKQESKLYKEAYKALINKGEEYLQEEGYAIFNMSFANANNPARDRYFNMLMDKGYGGARDINDINNGYTDEPLRIFNPSKSVHKASSKVLYLTDMQTPTAGQY